MCGKGAFKGNMVRPSKPGAQNEGTMRKVNGRVVVGTKSGAVCCGWPAMAGSLGFCVSKGTGATITLSAEKGPYCP